MIYKSDLKRDLDSLYSRMEEYRGINLMGRFRDNENNYREIKEILNAIFEYLDCELIIEKKIEEEVDYSKLSMTGFIANIPTKDKIIYIKKLVKKTKKNK